MKRIAMRSWAVWFLIAVLVGGMALFAGRLFAQGETWVMKPGSPHVYEPGTQSPAKGIVYDKNGNLLLSYGQGRVYSQSAPLRQSMLHWLGDRQGNIRAPMISHYAQEMAGFDILNGMYDYGDQGGKATLTISAQLQQVALEAMGDYKGTVAVYNYKTGQILCAVTTPNFDPDQVPDIAGDTTGQYEGIYLNRFTQSAYIPGSIFKVVTTAAALEEIPDIRERTFYCDGTYYFGADQVTCETAHGTVDLKKAMMVSCNCAYAQIAMLLGGDELQVYVDRFGVLSSISFDGITTAAGNISLKNQADVQVAWSAIGQHKDQVNPCAFLTFMGAVANGGQGVNPYMVESIRVGNRYTYRARTAAMDRILSEETAEILKEYMRNNVVKNYGADHFPGMTVCAKSGTGEVGGDKKPNALFTGFVADEEYPYAFIVVVENGGYGKPVCVPIISKILAAAKNL